MVFHAPRQVYFIRFFLLEYVYTRATLQEQIGNQHGWLYVGKIGNNINNYNKYTSIVEQTGSDFEKVSTPWTRFGAERNRRIFKTGKKLKA